MVQTYTKGDQRVHLPTPGSPRSTNLNKDNQRVLAPAQVSLCGWYRQSDFTNTRVTVYYKLIHRGDQRVILQTQGSPHGTDIQKVLVKEYFLPILTSNPYRVRI